MHSRENATREGVLFTHPPVDCSRLLSAVNDLTTTFVSKKNMTSTSGHSTATMRCWMKKTTNAISDTGRKESVQVVLLQTHGGDSASLSVLLGSLIGVSPVHFCLICSVSSDICRTLQAMDTSFSYISRTPQRMGNRSGFSCSNLSISMGSDRKFLQISF